jgi:hypothetical protein
MLPVTFLEPRILRWVPHFWKLPCFRPNFRMEIQAASNSQYDFKSTLEQLYIFFYGTPQVPTEGKAVGS